MFADEIKAMSDHDLEELAAAAKAEREARRTLAIAAERAAQIDQQHAQALDSVARGFHAARARVAGRDPSEPQPYRQPTGAHDAWPKGSLVEDQGKVWESLIPNNVWRPGESGWREVVPDAEPGEPQAYPQFVQPGGAHDAYQTGDRVAFEGQVHESTIDGNVWSPAAHPAGWRLLEGND